MLPIKSDESATRMLALQHPYLSESLTSTKDSISSHWLATVVYGVLGIPISYLFGLMGQGQLRATILAALVFYVGSLLALFLYHLVRAPLNLLSQNYRDIGLLRKGMEDLASRIAEVRQLPKAISEPEPPPLPNILAESSVPIDAHRGHRGVISDGTENRGDNFKAVIATYRNTIRSDREIGGRGDVSARIRYLHYDEAGSTPANRIAWLSHDGFRVVFGVNDAHTLVIATHENGQFFAIEENVSTGSQDKMRKVPLKGNLHGVYVEFLSESESKVIATSEFMLEAKGLITIEKPNTWKRRRISEFVEEGRVIAKLRDDDPDREAEFLDWKQTVFKFIHSHLGQADAARFLPPEAQVSPHVTKAMKLLEPPTFAGKVLAKTESLERIRDDIGLDKG